MERRNAPAPGLFVLLAVLYAGFIVYGGLVPFHFHDVGQIDYVATAWLLVSGFQGITSRSDFVANTLLFVPLGFLLLGGLSLERPRLMWLLAPLVVLASGLFSLVIEILQLHVEGRTSYAGDVVANTLGAALGVFLWLTCGLQTVRWMRDLRREAGEQPRLADKLLPAYVLFIIVVQTLPFDITISPADLYRKYRDGGVRLMPFAAPPGVDDYELIEKYLWQLAYFLPGGLLWSYRRFANRWEWPGVLLLGIGFAGLIEFLQFFVVSHSVDMTDVLLGGLAVLAGWAIGIETQRGAHNLVSLLAFGWLAAVLFINWRPFTFVFERPPNWPETWTPFLDYQAQDYFHALDQIIRKGLLFFPGGLLLRSMTGLRSLTAAVIIDLALAAFVECGQLYLPGRHFSVTDIIVETAAATLAFVLAGTLIERYRFAPSL